MALKALFRAALVLAPVMIHCVKSGAPKQVLEVPDIAALAATE